MNLVKLTIAGQLSVPGTFDYSACLVGGSVLYNVNVGGKPVGPIATALVPDAGDDAPPNIEVLDDSLLGVTSKGRKVLAFRSGNRKPDGSWDNTSSLYLGIGAESVLRPSGQSVVVQVSQPGPAGPAGPRGATGPAGPPGEGADMALTDDDLNRIAEAVNTYPAAADHFGIAPAEAQSGLWSQDAITVLLSNQAVWQRLIVAIDEAVLNLQANNYQPQSK